MCDTDAERLDFVRRRFPGVLTCGAEGLSEFVRAHSRHGGADAVLEVAGSAASFRAAWECARPNAVVTVVALYDGPQTLPLPEMYGKNLTFKTGGVDGCRCKETLDLIAAGRLYASRACRLKRFPRRPRRIEYSSRRRVFRCG